MPSNIENKIFNRFLKTAIMVAIILISTGSLLNAINHNLPTSTHSPNLWLNLIKSGVILLISLQILRVLYIAIAFLFSKELLLMAMSFFITITLGASLFFAHLPIFATN